jgi:multidrug efflux pump subunit AcrB
MRISTGFLSAMLAVAVGFAGAPRPAHSAGWLELLGISPATSPPVISVEAVYPGASAQVVADTVAAPIEEQVNGVEKMRYMRSRCNNDGTYRLDVTFNEDADANVVQILVQNRVALAQPVLPQAVQKRGVMVKKKLPGAMMIVILRSPDGSRNIRDLSNEATVRLKDELARLPGSGDVTCIGGIDCGVRVKLNAEKMAARKLTAGDVVAALQEQNAQAAAGQIGQPATPPRKGFQVTIAGPRLADPEQLREIVLKADAEGHVTRLKDVAGVEAETGAQGSQARLNGKPVVALAVYLLPGASPRKVSATVQTKLAELRPSLATGVDVDVSFDFTSNPKPADRRTAPQYLLLDLIEPGGASAERTLKALTRCQTLLHDVAGVQDILALPENPLDAFSARPCLIVRLTPTGKTLPGPEKVAETIRARLAPVAEATVRLRDLSAPNGFRGAGYPIEMAIEDRGLEQKHLGELANQFAKRLRETKKLTDVWADSELVSPQVQFDVDRAKAARQGVSLNDISSTLQVAGGGLFVNDSNRFGQTGQVRVESESTNPADIGKLAVRSASGQMVSLSAIVSVRTTVGQTFIDRFNMYPIAAVSANPAAGVSLDQVHATCEAQFAAIRKELGLSEAYRLSWLSPARKAGL